MRNARASGASPPDDDEPEFRTNLEVLKVATVGPGVPPAISDGNGGVRATTRVTPEICTIIRQVQGLLSNEELSDLLGFSTSTIRHHAYGHCNHSSDERDGRDPPRNIRDESLQERVTDPDTMVITGTGSSRFHKNAAGEPACGRGHRTPETANRGSIRDAVEAYIWNDPCKICFWRHYADDAVSRRIAEIEYDLAKRRREDADE